MLWKVFVALLVAWVVLVVSRYTLDGFVHLLFLIAVVIGLVQILWRREAV